MLHLNFEGRRKPECTDVVIAAHAMRENHYATLVHNSEISQVSVLQDKHTASSFSYVLERVTSIQYKSMKNP